NAIVGFATNLASRIQSVAEPNSVVISEDTHKLTQGYFEFKDFGKHKLKGISKPINLYKIGHKSAARNRLETSGVKLTPFTGRLEEIKILNTAWEETIAGSGRVIHLIGEGGLGKSRMLHWLKNEVIKNSSTWITEIYCSAYHSNSAYYPIIQLLEKNVLNFLKEDSNQDKLRRLEGLIALYGMDVEENLPLLAEMLSIPHNNVYGFLELTPQRKKSKTIDLLVNILLHRAAIQPVVFIAEDLHWSDPSTIELLESLTYQSKNHSIFILFAYRPQLNYKWVNTRDIIKIELNGLARAEAEEIIKKVVGSKKIPTELLDFIISKTEGVPLYIEEMTKEVFNSDLFLEQEVEFKLKKPIDSLEIPSTLHDLLMTKLDRIPEARNIAQLAAIIGREFSYKVLFSVSGLDKQHYDDQLDKLVESEVISFKENDEEGVPIYKFKHALIQDSAYSSLLKSTRKQYHQLIGDRLLAISKDFEEKQPELLAYHYTKAYNTLKAIQYWLKAGVRSIQRSENLEAILHLRQGLNLIKFLDSDEKATYELQLLSAIGPALIATRGFADKEIGEVYMRANQLSQKIGNAPQIFIPIWGQW
ncbi:MAG: AAA family ATPase, partial [Lutimonas sp.]